MFRNVNGAQCIEKILSSLVSYYNTVYKIAREFGPTSNKYVLRGALPLDISEMCYPHFDILKTTWEGTKGEFDNKGWSNVMFILPLRIMNINAAGKSTVWSPWEW